MSNLYSLNPEFVVCSNVSNCYVPAGSSNTTGSVRYNFNYQAFEVDNGCSWTVCYPTVQNISLTTEAQNILYWARTKMVEEARDELLCSTNPELKSAKEQYDAIRLLAIRNEEDRCKYVEKLKVEQSFVKSLTTELEKVKVECLDAKNKLNMWGILATE
jgi:hypothetical protein